MHIFTILKVREESIYYVAQALEEQISRDAERSTTGNVRNNRYVRIVPILSYSIDTFTRRRSMTSYNHKSYEDSIGVHEWLARLEDAIFEGLPLERAKLWPMQFSEAIPEGAELDKLKVPFICYVLEQNIATMQTLLETEQSEEVVKHIKAAIAVNEQMIAAQLGGDEAEIEAASEAAWAAWSAHRATSRAAWAAQAAAWAAQAAAWAAWSAHRATSRAAWAASGALYTKFADKLLELLRSCD